MKYPVFPVKVLALLRPREERRRECDAFQQRTGGGFMDGLADGISIDLRAFWHAAIVTGGYFGAKTRTLNESGTAAGRWPAAGGGAFGSGGCRATAAR